MDNFVFKRVKWLAITGEMRVLLKDFSSLVGCDLEEQPSANKSTKSNILAEVV